MLQRSVLLNYPVYDLQLYAILKALQHWRHHLLCREFVLYTDHQALKFVQDQNKLSSRHAKWVTSLQEYTFSIVHKAGSSNKVADALSRRHRLLSAMSTYTFEFEHVPETLREDPDFRQILEDVKKKSQDDYSLHNGYLFRGLALCIPATSLRYLIIKEMHNQGHFGLENTLHLVQERFFWQSLWRDVKNFVRACQVCQTSKGTNTNQGLYNPLPLPFGFWRDILMDFVTRLPMTRRKNDSIMVVIDRFSKMTVFIACKITVNVSKIAELYFHEVVRHHGLPSTHCF